MSTLEDKLIALQNFQEQAPIRIQTLGQFNLWRNTDKISSKAWGRDKTVQLFQYFISHHHRHALHREKIMDHIWDEGDDRDFKVALHGINKILEPDRAPRTDPIYLIRQGVSYHLDTTNIWIDVDALEKYVIIGNEALGTENSVAKAAYKNAIELYQGIYLPNRIYEDWSSEAREKVQVLILGAYITLAETVLQENPTESIRLAQNALAIDPSWEDAYRIQMQAYIAKGNRPQAIKAYQKCVDVLDEEFGIDPLPETRNLLKEIESIH
jgi:DNA-binding SARP family transcriptional activator